MKKVLLAASILGAFTSNLFALQTPQLRLDFFTENEDALRKAFAQHPDYSQPFKLDYERKDKSPEPAPCSYRGRNYDLYIYHGTNPHIIHSYDELLKGLKERQFYIEKHSSEFESNNPQTNIARYYIIDEKYSQQNKKPAALLINLIQPKETDQQ